MSQTPDELGQKIKEAQARQEQGQASSAPKAEGQTPAAKAVRAATDLGAAIFVGGVLGYWIDKWANTRPLFMILLLFAGFAAGFLNLYRSQMGEQAKTGTDKKRE